MAGELMFIGEEHQAEVEDGLDSMRERRESDEHVLIDPPDDRLPHPSMQGECGPSWVWRAQRVVVRQPISEFPEQLSLSNLESPEPDQCVSDLVVPSSSMLVPVRVEARADLLAVDEIDEGPGPCHPMLGSFNSTGGRVSANERSSFSESSGDARHLRRVDCRCVEERDQAIGRDDLVRHGRTMPPDRQTGGSSRFLRSPHMGPRNALARSALRTLPVCAAP